MLRFFDLPTKEINEEEKSNQWDWTGSPSRIVGMSRWSKSQVLFPMFILYNSSRACTVYHNQKVLVSRLRVKLKFYVKFCVLRSDSVKYCEVLSLIFSFLCQTTLVLFGNVDFRCSVERDEWKFYPSIKVQNYLLNCSNCNQTRVFLWMKW